MILTITPNPLLDYVIHSKEKPQPGGHRVRSIDYTVGGKGINVARMLKTFGRPALALGFAGGPNGQKIKTKLVDQGVYAEFVETHEETRLGINYVIEKPHDQTWWIEEGNELQESEVAALIELTRSHLPKTSLLAMSGTISGRKNQDLYRRILESIKDFRGEIYLDARGEALREACKVGGFFLKHNRNEAIETFGIDPFVETHQHSFFKKLQNMRIWGAMITDGKNNILLWDGNKIFLLEPAPSVEVSAVGCGDATLAGILFGRSENMSLFEASLLGLAAGAADSQYPGPCEAEFRAIEHKVSLIKVLSATYYS